MRNQHFSNQKTALEEYFQSLLSDDENSHQDINTAIDNKAPDLDKDIDTDLSGSVRDETVTDVSENLAATGKRPSVADMLANVETVETEVITSEISGPVPKKDFAEPEPEIIIPLPEVAPVIEVKSEVAVPTEIEVKTDISVETITEQKSVKQLQDVQTVSVEEKSEIVVATTASSDSPDWAASPFQCLLFNVGGLSLAVPLVKLNGVIPWSDKVVETPNQTDWYLGVLMNHGNKVQVIDTAVMVLPEKHRLDMPKDPAERLSHILLVDDQKWGLSCDSIGEVVTLVKDDVKWRSNKTKRPWLLGTAIEQMCAVVDTEAFAEMLEGSK